MAFVWKETTNIVSRSQIIEVRENIDYIEDNTACITHRSTYLNAQRDKADNAVLVANCKTQYGTHRDANYGYDSSDNNTNESHRVAHFSGWDAHNSRDLGTDDTSYLNTKWDGL